MAGMNPMFSHVIALSAIAAVFASIPVPILAAGNEIHYQSIESVRGDTAIVADHSPGGNARYTCSTEKGDCTKLKKGTSVLPEIQGKTDYLASKDGSYGVREKTSRSKGRTRTTFTIYDISGDSPKEVGSLSVTGNVIKKAFSGDEDTFVVVTNDSTVTSYDIPTKKSRTILTLTADIPFFNVSYKGSYISAYNYDTKTHRIWNTKTGTLIELKGTPGYVEFSESEDEAAFPTDDDGFKNLMIASGFGDGSTQIASAASGRYLVEDYLYVGDTLYYLANKASPLSWNLYAREGDSVVATGVSYGEYLKRVDGKLAYIKIEGKNANVYLYDPKSEKHVRLAAAPSSSATAGIEREETTIAGRSAALLTPLSAAKSRSRKPNLFLWLHGGPQRQTSVGYHPYLSYAVYDELLERLASAGNYVLKLDYSGSWGYGQDFINMLDRNVGVVEIADVKNAIEKFAKDHDIEHTYLIGNSYGGYMAMKGVNDLTDTVDGMVSINGVSDWEELIRRIPSSPFRELFDGVPGGVNGTLYANASTVSHSDKISKDTPLLVLYGTADNMVPTWQSTDYTAFMKAHDKNIILKQLKGEKHVLEKRSTLTTLCKSVVNALSLTGISCSK
ncbi:prolyl oligopeptidase family serine peptidase [Candidatus Kaiserbacteria bacterium]|nr:prolyl oligopeptidase family serine peptidase [Candidatus Kaiserbacteria bacterium]